ncbi:hypothetical protein NL108_018666 [Boleophthalmus pectinirostris]|nr:hypothetical protein NL108_018666 [Boleophthalmus pectinirostris]
MEQMIFRTEVFRFSKTKPKATFTKPSEAPTNDTTATGPAPAPVSPRQSAPVSPRQPPSAPVSPRQPPSAPVSPRQPPSAPVSPRQPKLGAQMSESLRLVRGRG